jgi:hypothetical protein
VASHAWPLKKAAHAVACYGRGARAADGVGPSALVARRGRNAHMLQTHMLQTRCAWGKLPRTKTSTAVHVQPGRTTVLVRLTVRLYEYPTEATTRTLRSLHHALACIPS